MTVTLSRTTSTDELVVAATTALLTDMYELTMLDAALADGTAAKPAVFEVYTRHLPGQSEYGIVAGTDRVVDAVLNFRFSAEQVAYLRSATALSERCLSYLAAYRFSGDLYVRPEGEAFTSGSRIVTVEASFGEAVLLETVVLSALNHGCTIATTAAAISAAARGKDVIEMGSRRTHEASAVDAARAAWIAGFAATSNLEAGMRYGVPVSGTAAHAWTLAHTDEQGAFEAQIAALGVSTVLLVDTYCTGLGIEHAVAAAKKFGASGPGGIRIDSGDLFDAVPVARAQLDRLGATATKIIVSGDLDAGAIRELEAAKLPIDGYGVGTKLVAAYPVGLVYKLTEITDAPGAPSRWVAKTSAGKTTQGGAKRSFKLTEAGRVVAELVVPAALAETVELAGRQPWDELAITGGLDARHGDTVSRTVAARQRFEGTLATVDRLPLYSEGF